MRAGQRRDAPRAVPEQCNTADEDRTHHAIDVKGPGVLPWRPIHAEQHQREDVERNHQADRRLERRRVVDRQQAVKPQPVCPVIRKRDEYHVEQNLGQPPPVEQVPHQQRTGLHQADLRRGTELDAPNVGGEQAHADEKRGAHEKSEAVIQRCEDHRHHATRDRKCVQQQRHLTFRKTERDEPIGAVVQPALGNGPPRQRPGDGDERRVEQWDRHDRQRDKQDGDQTGGSLVGGRHDETRERGTEKQTPGIAQED